MILHALCRYYEILKENPDLPKPGYSSVPISFAVEISNEGLLEQIIDIRSTGKKPIPVSMIVPFEKSRSSDKSPFFLRDNLKYVFGIEKKQETRKQDSETILQNYQVTANSKDRFEAFKKFHHERFKDRNEPEIISFLKFLDSWKPDSYYDNPVISKNIELFDNNTNFIFRIGERYLHEQPFSQDIWADYFDDVPGEKQMFGQCLVTGKTERIVRRHNPINVDPKVKAPLISFNDPAFCSYGKDQGENAPVGKSSMIKYTTSLNYLLRSKSENKIRIGDTVIVFWAETKEDIGTLVNGLINNNPADEDFDTEQLIHDILIKVKTGQNLKDQFDLEQTNFFIIGLSSNKGRNIVQFWHQDSFGNFITNVARHHLDMEIGERGPRNISFFRLVLSTYPKQTSNKKRTKNEKPNDGTTSASSNKITHSIENALIRSILMNRPYPVQLFSSMIKRMKTPRKKSESIFNLDIPTGFIKAYLLRLRRAGLSSIDEGLITVSLNEESMNVPYRLGRLFSVFEMAQRSANPKIERTIQNSYFSSASSTPGVVFPILNKLNQHHLAKLKTDKPGLGIYYSKLIGDIVAPVDKFPMFLSLEDQGMFMLGYYHQSTYRKSGENEQQELEEDHE